MLLCLLSYHSVQEPYLRYYTYMEGNNSAQGFLQTLLATSTFDITRAHGVLLDRMVLRNVFAAGIKVKVFFRSITAVDLRTVFPRSNTEKNETDPALEVHVIIWKVR